MPVRAEFPVSVELYAIATRLKHYCHSSLSDMVYRLNQIVSLHGLPLLDC
jgi:hypothetical protein